MKPLFFIPAAAVMLLTTACSTREAPEYVEPPEDYCIIDLSARHPVTVRIIDDTSFDESMSMTINRPETAQTRATASYRRRYVVKAINPTDNRIIAQGVSFSNEITLPLPVGKIAVIAWVDCTVKDDPVDEYYFTDEWEELLLVSRYPYAANDYMKAAAWGRIDIAMPYNKSTLEVPVKQAVGGFRLIATDSPDDRVKSISVSYGNAVPSAINGLTGEISHSWSDCSFSGFIEILDNDNTQLGFDVFPVGSSRISVPVSVTMYDNDNRIVANVNNIDIPVERGKITKVYAPFYSIREVHPSEVPGGGGVNIDPTFNSEIVIEI